MPFKCRSRGVTLVELVVFIAVVAVALVGLLAVFNRAVTASIDPIMQVRALELAQARLDEVLSRKFAENTPTGGVPACGSFDAGGGACTAIQGITADPGLDDVGDYDGASATDTGYTVSVSVTAAGEDLVTANALPSNQARRVTVTVTLPDSTTLQLSAYKVNF